MIIIQAYKDQGYELTQAYQLFNRKTGRAVGGYTTIACAYDDQQHTGYFSEYNAIEVVE